MTEALAHGRYAIARRLAAGGMGEVLLAEYAGDDEISPGLLVVKRVLAAAPGLPPNEEQVRMLLEEGRLALRLSHENLVDTFRIEAEGGSPLLVMELLSGRSMAQLLGQAKKRREHVPVDIALAVLRGAARGLHFAHTLKGPDGRGLGLVHRDVSPANIFVTFDGKVKVIDFGVAKSEDSELKTATGILKGKLGYMSPEQSLGEAKLTAQADVWSLGVFFWETLIADRLFSSPNPTATLLQISQKEIPPPRSLRPDIPAPVQALTLKMLSRSLDERWKTCAELVRAIDALPTPIASAAEIGAFLAGRFPEEAAEGIHEAERASRRLRLTSSGSGQSVVDKDEADVATTVVPGEIRQQALAMARGVGGTAGSVAPVDDDELDTVRVTPAVLAELRGNKGRPKSAASDDDDVLATQRMNADVAKDTIEHRAPTVKVVKPSALASATVPALRPDRPSLISSTLPSVSPSAHATGASGASSSPPSITIPSAFPPPSSPSPLAETVQRPPPSPSFASRTSPPETARPITRSGLQTVPLSSMGSPAPAPAPRVPTAAPSPVSSPPTSPVASTAPVRPLSMVAVAATTFGVLAVLIGLGSSFLQPAREPMVFAFEDSQSSQSIVVGDPAHVPSGREYRVLDLALARLHRVGDRDGTIVPRTALEQRLRASGVWTRASLPTSPQAKAAAFLPVGVMALGWLMLAIAVPALVVSGGRRSLVQVALGLVVAAAVAAGVRFGVLSWPGLNAFNAAPQLRWDE
jgi:serine/threonine protein kinase